MNNVSLVGNMTKDAEFTDNGEVKVAKFTVAINNGKDKDGNDRPADFPNIVCFGHTAQFVNDYLGKGSKVAVFGRIHTRSYDAQDGTKRYITEVVAQSVEGMGKAAQNGTQDVEDVFSDLKPVNEFKPMHDFKQEELPF